MHQHALQNLLINTPNLILFIGELYFMPQKFLVLELFIRALSEWNNFPLKVCPKFHQKVFAALIFSHCIYLILIPILISTLKLGKLEEHLSFLYFQLSKIYCYNLSITTKHFIVQLLLFDILNSFREIIIP